MLKKHYKSYKFFPDEWLKAISVIFLTGFFFTGWAGNSYAQTDKPNVIIIFTDDQGTLDLNSYGATDLVTPHMDDLGKRGVSFTQFYAASPVCSPSRAGLLTGRDPNRAGMPGNAPSMEGVAGMSPYEVTIANMLQDVGYKTAHIGKWHLGYTPETMPNGQGFDYSFGHMGGVIDNYSHFFYWAGPNRHDLWRNGERIYYDGEYFPDLMVKEAEQFMRENRENPFFLYFAINLPHYPYQGDVEWLKYYQDQNVPYPRDLYNAFISTQDDRIGELMAVVDELGIREETLVIFQSDHGHSTEERAHYGGGYAGDYRGAKFSLFEGGIRVPAIVSMPGTIPEGEWRDQMAHGTDWFPTIATFTGANLPEKRLDGKDLYDVIMSDSNESPHEVLYWKLGNQWAVMEGEWKLIGNPIDSTGEGERTALDGEDQFFLSNIRLDPTEMKNFGPAHQDIVERLKQKYKEWVNDLD
jgi:arylsulfatase A